MPRLTYREALRQAMVEEMDQNQAVFMMGQDIGVEGGMWEVTKGMLDHYGPERVMDTPISESAIMGAGLGAAMTGQRPIVEIMYNDFIMAGGDQLLNQIAKSRYMFGGQVHVPMVIRAPCGYGFGLAAAHSQSLESWFTHLPGLFVIMPATPATAKGLLKASIRNDNPVLFIEHCLLYNDEGEVPDDPNFMTPLGKARIALAGGNLTLVCWSLMVKRSIAAAKQLKMKNVSIEVVDLQSTSPMDIDTVLESVRHTGRLLVVEQSAGCVSVGSEIVAKVAESGVRLKASPRRLSGKDIPIPFAANLEKLAIPDTADIVKLALDMIK